jgi:hypothetical protein
MKHVEWIWWNMVFWLCCELLTWKCVVWWEHGIGSEKNVWKTTNGVWKFVDGVLIIVVWSLVFVIVWSEEKMAHIVKCVEWIWWNVLFQLCCDLSMWKCIVWCEHGKCNEQDVWITIDNVLIRVVWSLVFFACKIF